MDLVVLSLALCVWTFAVTKVWEIIRSRKRCPTCKASYRKDGILWRFYVNGKYMCRDCYNKVFGKLEIIPEEMQPPKEELFETGTRVWCPAGLGVIVGRKLETDPIEYRVQIQHWNSFLGAEQLKGIQSKNGFLIVHYKDIQVK